MSSSSPQSTLTLREQVWQLLLLALLADWLQSTYIVADSDETREYSFENLTPLWQHAMKKCKGIVLA
jgi:hypothetical protein